MVAALVALATALINHRVAREGAGGAPGPLMGGEDPGPGSLIPDRPDLINRTKELRLALERLGEGEAVLAIEGGVGIGKSAIARELAYRLQSGTQTEGLPDLSTHHFVWIECGNTCPTLAELCARLSVLTRDQSLSAAPEHEKLDALRVHLATRKSVLVLDNLRLEGESSSQSIYELARSIPSGSIVIASINGPDVNLKGARIPLGELTPPDTLELIHREARRLGLENTTPFDDEFARRLETNVGGNPRVIELFMQGCKHSPHSLEEPLLAVERGEGLSELFSPVWSGLTQSGKQILEVCAALRGEATAEQLAIGGALATDRVAAALTELASAMLITAAHSPDQPSVFSCPPAVRLFVKSQQSDGARAQAITRLADHYFRRFSDDWEDASGAIPHVNALRTVLRALFDEGRDHEFQRLFGVTLDFFFTLGLFDDRITLGRLAYESAMRSEEYERASRAASVLSSTHAVRGELTDAREALALGLVAAERSGSPAEDARLRRDRGLVSYRSKQPEDALMAIEDADRLAHLAGDLLNEVDILDVRIASYWYLGKFEQCEETALRHLELCGEIPWERAKTYSLRHMAEVAIQRRDDHRAETLLERARSIAVEYEDRRALARIDLTQARSHLARSRPDEARRAASQAESAALALGLGPEAREARALRRAARRAKLLPPLRLLHTRRRRHRLTDAPIGGD